MPPNLLNSFAEVQSHQGKVRKLKEEKCEQVCLQYLFARPLELRPAAIAAIDEQQPILRTRTGTSARLQAYSTPFPIAYWLGQQADLRSDSCIVEPCAGHGALLLAAPDRSELRLNEIDPERAAFLKDRFGGDNVATEDALTWIPGKFDRLLLNPPFGSMREGKRKLKMATPYGGTYRIDYAIAARYLDLLEPGGIAAMLLMGVLGDRPRRKKSYQSPDSRFFYFWLYQKFDIISHITLDGRLYRKQGARYPVDAIVVRKRQTTERCPLYPWALDPYIYKELP